MKTMFGNDGSGTGSLVHVNVDADVEQPAKILEIEPKNINLSGIYSHRI